MMNIEGEEMRKPIRLIAAACRDMGIGKNGQLPWSLPKEFQFFMDTITAVSAPGKKNLVVWGRISLFSCPETVFPLANCINLVLSRKLTFPGVPDEIHEENGIKFQFQVFKKEV
ncbi:hypothetical protein cypCar_00019732 [Cyprinus carpio]|nr:hypothetical protein cypCar_00019732 [Cyprinus carpio]